MSKRKLILEYLLIFTIAMFAPVFSYATTIVATPDSGDATVTASVGSVIPPCPTCVIGGGGGDYSFGTNINFSGWAYPGASVFIWKDGKIIKTTIADSMGAFSADIDEKYSESTMYTLYAIDKDGRKSTLLNYPIAIKNGYYTQIRNIRFAPTVSLDKISVKFGDSITVTGYALPENIVDISLEGPANNIFQDVTSFDGTYKFNYSLLGYPKGEYVLSISYKDDKRSSKLVRFTIGDVNIYTIESINNIPGDCNADQIINLIDFSVLAFWYGKPNPPRCVDTNNDDIINLVDFSILAFYWTG